MHSSSPSSPTNFFTSCLAFHPPFRSSPPDNHPHPTILQPKLPLPPRTQGMGFRLHGERGSVMPVGRLIHLLLQLGNDGGRENRAADKIPDAVMVCACAVSGVVEKWLFLEEEGIWINMKYIYRAIPIDT
ncbi:hypothetical protein GLAREA_01347 [Glarea lozoyensis ATCC 20868]|uniref:Uncharacterized protein n=1 Tax=Glarea lozoyensis (strain ATCC 20868 / MF5171) TaxID=1116229 RepID=S3CHV7_GLAL2|nr:uncharacterized protein GLAREA_01347 [Glarea lozoyensis ATCC 20868]EPE25435.1 hypothetical protein GLAREA_01347 [Glarea lozoyensis ATCC 20868]